MPIETLCAKDVNPLFVEIDTNDVP